jgi:hypothetical protein
MSIQVDTYTGEMILVNALLNRDHHTSLAAFLAFKRSNGTSFENIARDLVDLVGIDGFNIGYQTARRWCQRVGA